MKHRQTFCPDLASNYSKHYSTLTVGGRFGLLRSCLVFKIRSECIKDASVKSSFIKHSDIWNPEFPHNKCVDYEKRALKLRWTVDVRSLSLTLVLRHSPNGKILLTPSRNLLGTTLHWYLGVCFSEKLVALFARRFLESHFINQYREQSTG